MVCLKISSYFSIFDFENKGICRKATLQDQALRVFDKISTLRELRVVFFQKVLLAGLLAYRYGLQNQHAKKYIKPPAAGDA